MPRPSLLGRTSRFTHNNGSGSAPSRSGIPASAAAPSSWTGDVAPRPSCPARSARVPPLWRYARPSTRTIGQTDRLSQDLPQSARTRSFRSSTQFFTTMMRRGVFCVPPPSAGLCTISKLSVPGMLSNRLMPEPGIIGPSRGLLTPKPGIVISRIAEGSLKR